MTTPNPIMENGRVQITVPDEGVGMDDKLIMELQSGDYADSLQGTANEQGTGLGLVLTREFIARHGSRMVIQSKEGEGSRFLFLLPVTEGEVEMGAEL